MEEAEIAKRNTKRLRVVHRNKILLDRPVLIPENFTDKQINAMMQVQDNPTEDK